MIFDQVPLFLTPGSIDTTFPDAISLSFMSQLNLAYAKFDAGTCVLAGPDQRAATETPRTLIQRQSSMMIQSEGPATSTLSRHHVTTTRYAKCLQYLISISRIVDLCGQIQLSQGLRSCGAYLLELLMMSLICWVPGGNLISCLARSHAIDIVHPDFMQQSSGFGISISAHPCRSLQ